MGGQRSLRPRGLELCFGRSAGTFAAIAPAVATVASLGEGVGAKADEVLRLDELVHLIRCCAVVDIVHDLVPLVAEPAMLLEAGGTVHAK